LSRDDIEYLPDAVSNNSIDPLGEYCIFPFELLLQEAIVKKNTKNGIKRGLIIVLQLRAGIGEIGGIQSTNVQLSIKVQ